MLRPALWTTARKEGGQVAPGGLLSNRKGHGQVGQEGGGDEHKQCYASVMGGVQRKEGGGNNTERAEEDSRKETADSVNSKAQSRPHKEYGWSLSAT